VRHVGGRPREPERGDPRARLPRPQVAVSDLRSRLETWLRARLEGVPESLRARIQEAAASVAASGREAELASLLAEAGAGLLARAKAMPPSREAALTLLAADALMTYACEALAEEAPERLGELR